MQDHRAIVLSNERATDILYVMRLESPKLASEVAPGQFIHMQLPDMEANILRRPFSVYAADPELGTVDILYQVVGSGTDRMTRWQPGFVTTMIGPIGSRWEVPADAKRALLVGGGVGAAPLFMLYEELIGKGIEVDVVLGAANKDSLVCMDRYERVCGKKPDCSTDDGSFGREGFCTSLVEDAIARAASEGSAYGYCAVCGPEPLMRIASGMAFDAGIPCQVSMERRMACGIGACLSCVVETVDGKKRSCVDGPIFDAEKVVW